MNGKIGDTLLLEEFLVVLGANTETEKVKSFTDALSKTATIGAVVVGALKAVTLAAWNFADSYIRRADELAQANSELYHITKEQVEMSKKYQEGMGKLGDIIESIKIKVAFGFLPTMLNMVDTFNKFLDANKDLIANGITRLLNIVSYASQVINNTVRFIVKAIEATIGWKGALFVLGAAFLFLRRAMLLAFITNPITWVIAAIVGLMLLIDDFMTYLDGGESQFGEFWGAMLEWVEKAKQAWSSFSEDAKSSIKAVGVALALLASSTVIIKTMTVVFSVLGSTISFLISPILNLIKVVSLLGKAFLIAGRFMIANPIVLIAGIIAGIIYVIYDLIKWIKTGESSFGGFWKYLADIWEKIKAKVISVKDSIVNSIKDLITSMTDSFSKVFDVITQPFERAFNWISEKFGALGGLIGNAVSGAGRLFGIGSNSAVSNSSSIMNTTTINAPISVSSSDPNKAASLVNSGISNTFNAAQRNTSSKVKI